MSVLNVSSLTGLAHDQLLTQLHDLIERDHTLEAELIAHLAEVDARRLYLERACPSMFHYCVHVLHFAEGVAYKRIAVARAARECPELLAALEEGDLHLTAASLLAPHLNRECAEEWLAAARHKTGREIKQWIADRKPKAEVKTSLRKAPTPKRVAQREPAPNGATRLPDAASPHAAPAAEPLIEPPREVNPACVASAAPRNVVERATARIEPLGADRYCVRFTIDAVVHELRALLRHQIPDGDVAKIVGRAVHALLGQARKQKRGACSSPRSARSPETPAALSPGSSRNSAVKAGAELTTPGTDPADAPSKRPCRKIPTAIRRAVWERDEGRCGYVSREGRQCGTRDFLEFHHQLPWARCREHRESNIGLRCRAHNQHAAELDFGAQHMVAYRKREVAFAAGEADSKRVSDPGQQVDLNPVGVANADRAAVHGLAEKRAPGQQPLGLGAD